MRSIKKTTGQIILNILLIIGLGFAWVVTTNIIKVTLEEYRADPSQYVYGEGNAPPEVRQEIMDQLILFQKGYEERDTAKLGMFMDQLFSKEQVLVLGTMPREIYSGYAEAADLVSSDWLYWGDVRFHLDQSHISILDSVAWFSTIGAVEFDMSRFLNLPLRFTGILAREDATWKFQQAQFQFDLDTSWVLGSIFLVSLLLIASLIRLLFLLFRRR